ncbi:unnamed protein product [Symbiodinium microadriaticum]|nr:unnamed protein product [Symbiodinium microadriaticum]
MTSKQEKEVAKDLAKLLDIEEATIIVSPTKKSGEPQSSCDSPGVAVAAPSGDTKAAAPKAKAKAKAKAPKPCLICGLIVGIHPNNSAYCADHKRTVDAYTAACKAADKKEKGTKNMDQLNAIRQDCGAPPSQYSRLILEYEEQAFMDVGLLNQKHSLATEMRKEFICEYMHRDQWMHHAVDNMRWSPKEAELKWNEIREKTDASQQDYNGPNRSLRLPMHIGDRVVGASVVSFETVVQSESKRRKLTGEKELEEMQDEAADLQKNISFKADMFKSAGGDVASVLAQSGGSAFVQSHGAGNFEGAGRGFSVDKPSASANSNPGDKICKLKEKISKVENECKELESTTAKHNNESDADSYLPTHASYMEVMKGRLEMLAMAGVSVGTSPPATTIQEEAAKKAHNALLNVSKAMEELEKNMTSMDAAAIEKLIIGELDGFHRSEKSEGLVIYQGIDAVLSGMGYTAPAQAGEAGAFTGPKPGLAKVVELRTCFNHAAAAFASNESLASAVTKRQVDGKPLPLQDMSSVPTLCRIEMYNYLIRSISSEDSLKTFKTSLTKEVQSLERLIAVVENGHKSVIKNIEAFKKRQEQDKKKGERKAAKQQLAQQKETTRAELPASKRCDFLDLSKHAVFVDMPRHENLQAIKGTSGVGMDTPHILKQDSTLNGMMEQRGIKASIGIFRIMFAQSDAAKADKTGQKAADFTDRDKVREAMLNVPGSVQVPVPKDNESVSMRAIRQLAFFGQLAGYGLVGEERQGLPAVRYRISGSKEVAIISMRSLLDFALQQNIDPSQGEGFFQWMKKVVTEMSSLENLEKFRTFGGKVWRGVVSAGETLYIPMASMVIDRVLGDNIVVGLRTCCLPAVPATVEGLSFLREHVKAQEGEEAPLLKFWAEVEDASDFKMSMAMTLPPGDAQRWEQRKEKVGTAKAYVTDLEQKLGFVTSGEYVPTLVKHGKLVSLTQDTHFTPWELMFLMGDPVYGSKGFRSPMLEAKRRGILSDRDVKAMAGNSMHVAAVGTILCYGLACLEQIGTATSCDDLGIFA